MTKNIFIVAIAVLLSVAFCSLSAQNVSKDYNVDEFSAINLQSVGNIIFTQSAGCSCRLEGPSEFVEKTRVTVKNGTLVISYKDRNARNIKNLICYITAPDLSKVKNIAFELDGVGNCNVKSLYCDELKLDVDGVGNMKLNVDCSTIKAKVDGVGNITVSGKADAAFFKRDGVGKINSKNLKCKDVTKKGWNF